MTTKVSVVPHQVDHDNIPSQDKYLRNIIQKLDEPYKLIRFAENPNICGEAVPGLNSYHWALLLNKLSNDSASNYKVLRNNQDKIYGFIKDKMLPQIPDCIAGNSCQIAKAMGVLGVSGSEVENWVLNNAMTHLADFNVKEFYMLIHGAEKILCPSKLFSLLEAYNKLLRANQNKCKILLEELKPQGIACVLKACANAEWHGKLYNNLFRQAELKIAKFTIQEKIDLIAGLSGYAYTNRVNSVSLLSRIESDLAEMEDLSLTSLSIALSRFAGCGYVPTKLLNQVMTVLGKSETKMWDKISLFHSLALLGLNKDFAPAFQTLLNDLYQTNENNKKVFMGIYDEDLIRLMHSAAVFLPNIRVHNAPSEILAFLRAKLPSLQLQERTRMIAPLCAFGLSDQAKEFGKDIVGQPSVSCSQQHITNVVKYELQSHKALTVHSEAEINGILVDVLIECFEKPIVMEIHGPHHWACNIPTHELGRTILRSKALNLSDCEVKVFDLRKGLSDVAFDVIAFLQSRF